jgi:16S rRNA (guanine527-N7)-methyltransferase
VAALGIRVSPEDQARLVAYLALLDKWNNVYNLTAIREVDRMVSHHLLDSLGVVPYLEGKRLLDVGSGAGLPGIPMAVARPDLEVTLLDSNHKKVAFLQQAIAELELKNASVCAERVEAWRPATTFDVVISRAFADLAEFVALAKHLLAADGVLLAMKGVYPFEEIERLPAGFRLRDVIRLEIPGLDAERHLVRVVRA